MKSLVALLSLVTLLHAEDDFKPLFNGRDLTGWDGNPELWSVEDGALTGKTKGPESLKYNQFLIWRGGVLKNFELRAKIKQAGNNTGIQYRSREFPEVGKWSVGGYQCDIHPAAPNNGMVYGEKWGGILVQNGQSVVIDPDGKKWLTAKREPVAVDIAEWHDYTIIAQGNHLVHKIDGQVTIDLLDFGAKTQRLEGILAFQLHRGPAMTVQIKDVMLKELPDAPVPAFDKSLIANAKPVEKADAKPKGIGKAKAEARRLGDVPPAASSAESIKSAGSPEWKWLWSDSPASKSAARLKKAFDLGNTAVKDATLRVTCDNGAEVFLNGESVLVNPDWQRPTQANVTKKLRAGKNELRAEATNKGSAAGFIAVLEVKFADGTERTIFTDASWSAAAPGTDDWKPAKVVNEYGKRPYGEIFDKSQADKRKGAQSTSDEVIQPSDIRALPGFKVELIHKVPKTEEGSWVSMTVDDQGRLIASDQYGGLYRLTVPPVGSGDKAQIERLTAEISGAHGLLYAFDSLYVMVNEKPNPPGLYRFRHNKSTDQFEEKTYLREIRGTGEHGNHSLTLSHDGKSIYIACGNGTVQPEHVEHTRLARPFRDPPCAFPSRPRSRCSRSRRSRSGRASRPRTARRVGSARRPSRRTRARRW